MTSQPDATTNFFLLKSEPDDYSIADLQTQENPREEWDGVRNYQARNILKSMRAGDRAFFYHSSCKVPGIVGTVVITRGAIADETALDPDHCKYDPKSTSDECRWVSVQVELEDVFPSVVPLKLIRAESKTNPVLANMTLLRNSRLSVHALSKEEFDALLELQRRLSE